MSTSLIHEHYFVARRAKGADHFINCCVTCGDCYCHVGGKILGAPSRLAQHLIQFKTEGQSDYRVLDSKKLTKDIMNLALITAALSMLALLIVPGIISGNQKALAANLCGSGLGCGGTPNYSISYPSPLSNFFGGCGGCYDSYPYHSGFGFHHFGFHHFHGGFGFHHFH